MAIGFEPNPQTRSFAQRSLSEKQTEPHSLDATILKHFENLEDPWVERTKDHPLINVITIAIFAVIAGADGWTVIETKGKAKQKYRPFMTVGRAK